MINKYSQSWRDIKNIDDAIKSDLLIDVGIFIVSFIIGFLFLGTL